MKIVWKPYSGGDFYLGTGLPLGEEGVGGGEGGWDHLRLRQHIHHIRLLTLCTHTRA